MKDKCNSGMDIETRAEIRFLEKHEDALQNLASAIHFRQKLERQEAELRESILRDMKRARLRKCQSETMKIRIMPEREPRITLDIKKLGEADSGLLKKLLARFPKAVAGSRECLWVKLLEPDYD